MKIIKQIDLYNVAVRKKLASSDPSPILANILFFIFALLFVILGTLMSATLPLDF
jgi:hypothetical protein